GVSERVAGGREERKGGKEGEKVPRYQKTRGKSGPPRPARKPSDPPSSKSPPRPADSHAPRRERCSCGKATSSGSRSSRTTSSPVSSAKRRCGAAFTPIP